MCWRSASATLSTRCVRDNVVEAPVVVKAIAARFPLAAPSTAYTLRVVYQYYVSSESDRCQYVGVIGIALNIHLAGAFYDRRNTLQWNDYEPN